jgi:hypothetical protein
MKEKQKTTKQLEQLKQQFDQLSSENQLRSEELSRDLQTARQRTEEFERKLLEQKELADKRVKETEEQWQTRLSEAEKNSEKQIQQLQQKYDAKTKAVEDEKSTLVSEKQELQERCDALEANFQASEKHEESEDSCAEAVKELESSMKDLEKWKKDYRKLEESVAKHPQQADEAEAASALQQKLDEAVVIQESLVRENEKIEAFSQTVEEKYRGALFDLSVAKNDKVKLEESWSKRLTDATVASESAIQQLRSDVARLEQKLEDEKKVKQMLMKEKEELSNFSQELDSKYNEALLNLTRVTNDFAEAQSASKRALNDLRTEKEEEMKLALQEFGLSHKKEKRILEEKASQCAKEKEDLTKKNENLNAYLSDIESKFRLSSKVSGNFGRTCSDTRHHQLSPFPFFFSTGCCILEKLVRESFICKFDSFVERLFSVGTYSARRNGAEARGENHTVHSEDG